MKIDVEFLKSIGACDPGITWFVSKNYEGPVSLKKGLADLKSDYEKGLISEKLWVQWRDWWMEGHIHNPDTLAKGGAYTELNEFLIEAKSQSDIFTDLSEARLQKQAFIERQLEKFKLQLNIVSIGYVEGGRSTTRVNSLDDVKENGMYAVHNPFSGLFIDCVGREEFLQAITDISDIERSTLERIAVVKQKGEDTEEGFITWKEVPKDAY